MFFHDFPRHELVSGPAPTIFDLFEVKSPGPEVPMVPVLVKELDAEKELVQAELSRGSRDVELADLW